MDYIPYGLVHPFAVCLEAAAGGSLQADPTLAAGDVKVYSSADAAGANLDTIPAADPAGGVVVRGILSATETSSDAPFVAFIDAAGAEWLPKTLFFKTVPPQLLGIATGGLATAGAAATITLAAGTIVSNDDYKNCQIEIVWGTGKGQAMRTISGTVAATQVATVTPAWATQPDNTSVYRIYQLGVTATTFPVDLTHVLGTALNATATAGLVPTDVLELKETAQTTGTDLGGGGLIAASVTGAVGSVTGAVGSVTGAVGSVTGAVGSVTGSVGSIAANGITNASLAVDTGFKAIDVGTAQSATASTIVLRALAGFANSELVGCLAVITSATTGTGQVRRITGYVGSTDTATISPDWSTTPTGTITYAILPNAGLHTGEITSGVFAAGAITATAIATDAFGAAQLAAAGASEIATAVAAAVPPGGGGMSI